GRVRHERRRAILPLNDSIVLYRLRRLCERIAHALRRSILLHCRGHVSDRSVRVVVRMVGRRRCGACHVGGQRGGVRGSQHGAVHDAAARHLLHGGRLALVLALILTLVLAGRARFVGRALLRVCRGGQRVARFGRQGGGAAGAGVTILAAGRRVSLVRCCLLRRCGSRLRGESHRLMQEFFDHRRQLRQRVVAQLASCRVHRLCSEAAEQRANSALLLRRLLAPRCARRMHFDILLCCFRCAHRPACRPLRLVVVLLALRFRT
ncbi:hypothetical protein T484DRAFT_1962441, partial [Baffinella frigidus]